METPITKKYRVFLKKEEKSKDRSPDSLIVPIEATSDKNAKTEAVKQNPGYKAVSVFISEI